MSKPNKNNTKRNISISDNGHFSNNDSISINGNHHKSNCVYIPSTEDVTKKPEQPADPFKKKG